MEVPPFMETPMWCVCVCVRHFDFTSMAGTSKMMASTEDGKMGRCWTPESIFLHIPTLKWYIGSNYLNWPCFCGSPVLKNWLAPATAWNLASWGIHDSTPRKVAVDIAVVWTGPWNLQSYPQFRCWKNQRNASNRGIPEEMECQTRKPEKIGTFLFSLVFAWAMECGVAYP